MEWEIPEPLDIRPCQKPSELKPRQLNFYPLRLKKLPSWVDNATFQAENLSQIQTPASLPPLPQKEPTLEQQFFSSFYSKYRNREKYTLLYQKGEERYVFNQKFTFEYISSNYSELDDWTSADTNYRYQTNQNQKVNTARGSHETKLNQLIFDSRFECGNLSKVYQALNTDEYHLMMQNDINTLGYNQWFAFSIDNTTSQDKVIQLKIVNFVKSSSLYKKGMKPWFISQGSCAWKQVQDKCIYKKGNVKNGDSEFFSQLNFVITLPLGLTMIAMMPIYSYSKLCAKIQKWKSIKGMRLYHKKVYSLINNILPILEYIPHFDQEFSDNYQEIKWYDTIVVFARTHPGEVWSSFLMEEFIQTIVHYHKSNYVKFRYLILPMINPDGVIYGNFRCDFSGVDLNRVWIDPSRFTQPSIYNIKKILNKEFESKKAKYFIDLHSHSKALNVFAYTSAETLLESRLVLDLIRLSDENTIFDPIKSSIGLTKQFLTESQTTFLSSKQIPYSKKKSTARAFMSKLTQRGKSMTIEISFYGYENKKSLSNQIKLFQPRDFNDFSWCLLKKLHDYMNFKQDVMLAKKMLQPIYHSFYQYMYTNQSVTTVQSSPKKQTKVLDQKYNDQSQDSDSQPEKYYTAETKKIIKSKHGEVCDYKPPQKAVMTRKGYLKHTEAMIKRIEVIKKDKSNSGLVNQNKRQKIHQSNKQYQQLSLPFKHQESQKKPSFSDYVSKSHCDLPPSIQRSAERQMVESQTKLESSCLISEKTNFLRKKLILQSKRKEFTFSRQKRQQVSASKFIQPPSGHAISSIIEPVIIDIDSTKKPQPTFGKFLPKNKRNASRRYKTMVREDVATYKSQLQKMYANASKDQSCKHMMRLETEPPSFLEDRMYGDDGLQIKFDSQLSQLRLGKGSEVNLSCQQKKQSFKKPDQLYRKKSKKATGLDKIHNYKNKYLIQRKKIVQMMKKETRFYPQHQKQAVTAQQIEQIIQKRKRTNTDHQRYKNYFQDRNIFYQSKMNTMKNSQPSGKTFNNQQQESVSLLKREFPVRKELGEQ